MQRADGRPALSARPLLAKLQVNSTAAPGSSYVEFGGTRVFATV
jgi:ribonuclease PH